MNWKSGGFRVGQRSIHVQRKEWNNEGRVTHQWNAFIFSINVHCMSHESLHIVSVTFSFSLFLDIDHVSVAF